MIFPLLSFYSTSFISEIKDSLPSAQGRLKATTGTRYLNFSMVFQNKFEICFKFHLFFLLPS